MKNKRALKHLLDFLRIEGLSGREGQVVKTVISKLKEAGCKDSWIIRDQVHKKIPGDFETGNLIVKIPGNIKGQRMLFSAHMDTVPLCRGAQPIVNGNRIISKGHTGLGADNRTGVASLICLAERLLSEKKVHFPITMLFTVGEEVGLFGARYVSRKNLGYPRMGINLDAGFPEQIVTGAIGAHRWEAHIHGKSSHAGVHPDHGISANLVAALAISEVKRKGYFGKIRKKGNRGVSNVGHIHGGEACNQVTEYTLVKGESRSHDTDFLEEITAVYKSAFERASLQVKNHKKECARIKFKVEKDYEAFSLSKAEPIVQHALSSAKSVGLNPVLKVIDGGLDANYLNAKGIPTITLGVGQHQIHTVDEYVDLENFYTGCKLAYELAITTKVH